MTGTDDLVAVVLARTDSRRLPKKILLDFGQESLLGHVIARLAPLGSRTVLATTDRSVDDALAQHGADLGVDVVRGSTNNVAQRALDATDSVGSEWFVRINADSPFPDPGLLRSGAKLRRPDVDLVSNIPGRTFPYGVAVEIVRASSLRQRLSSFTIKEQEHVTLGLYCDETVNVVAMTSHRPDLRSALLTVDTAADLKAMRSLVDALDNSTTASWTKIAALEIQLDRRGKGVKC